ncbi:GntR family transcriptional regulator [Sphingopyxis sp.]|uniref:GntR family transcriptional regulator n=1 Tax=Sphingopyxis sp. TaxID=1908224 RepID=UPI001DBF1FF3|nr:GntR family transcriptional regulator [Sphingopyxis sp.]MBW8296326.1 GntR family transcriptional regulator [Sphingopyxis sp.]
MSTIVIRNLADQLAELVRDRILSGEVPDDLPIRQDALAAELGVSKIPLREALTRLEQEGLLRSQANKGYFVRPLSAEEAEEVYAIRLLLEPEATALAALRANEDQRLAAKASLKDLEKAARERGAGVGAYNRAFHVALIRPAGRPLRLSILERLHVLSERYVRKHLEPVGRDARARDEHRELLHAWLDRDGAKVIELTHAHIAQTLDDLRKQLPEYIK